MTDGVFHRCQTRPLRPHRVHGSRLYESNKEGLLPACHGLRSFGLPFRHMHASLLHRFSSRPQSGPAESDYRHL